MKINRKMLSVNKYSRPGQFIADGIRGVVIHYTGNPGSTPEQNINYFENLKDQSPLPGGKEKPDVRYASAHFFVGIDGDVWQCLPTSEMAYHVGAAQYKPGIQQRLGAYPNAHTIGIELCHADKSGRFTAETLEAAAELAAHLLQEFNLTADDLYRHFDVTGKDCPRWFVAHEDDWMAFRQSVRDLMTAKEAQK